MFPPSPACIAASRTSGDPGQSRPLRHGHGRRAGDSATELLKAHCHRGEGRDEGRAPPGTTPSTNGHGYQHRLEVGKWLAARGVDFRIKDAAASGGRTVYLIPVPVRPVSHGRGHLRHAGPERQAEWGTASTARLQCSGRGWQQFKEKIGKPDPEHYDPPMQALKRTSPKDRQAVGNRPGTTVQGADDEPNLTDRGNAIRLVHQVWAADALLPPLEKVAGLGRRAYGKLTGTEQPAGRAKCTIRPPL